MNAPTWIFSGSHHCRHAQTHGGHFLGKLNVGKKQCPDWFLIPQGGEQATLLQTETSILVCLPRTNTSGAYPRSLEAVGILGPGTPVECLTKFLGLLYGMFGLKTREHRFQHSAMTLSLSILKLSFSTGGGQFDVIGLSKSSEFFGVDLCTRVNQHFARTTSP